MSTVESRATLGVAITFLILTWLSISLRILVRFGMLRNFGLDDWIMLMTQVFFTAYLSCQIGGVIYGTGQHLSDLTVASAERALHYWYFCEIFYVCSTTFLKISIGLFLLRVSREKVHVWIIRVIMILASVFGFAFFFVIIFQCYPISDWWSLDPSQKRCINADIVVGLTFGVSALNVIADWTLGILPAFVVRGLQMSTRQKRLVAGLLSFAAIGSTATIVRLPYISALSQTFDGSHGDFLYNSIGVAIWTTVEIGIGITAGCIATLRPLIRLAFSRLGLSSSSGARAAKPFQVPDYSKGRGATPLEDFASPKHGRTITTITGNNREEDGSRGGSQEELSRGHPQLTMPGEITKHFHVAYEDCKGENEFEQGYTQLPRRN